MRVSLFVFSGTGNTAEDGVRFLDHCMMCMRCYSFCPQQAVQSTPRTMNLERYRRYQGPLGEALPGLRPYTVGSVAAGGAGECACRRLVLYYIWLRAGKASRWKEGI